MRCSERPLSAAERADLESRVDQLQNGRGWTPAEARRNLPGCLLGSVSFFGLAGIAVGLAAYGGRGRPVYGEVGSVLIASALAGIVVGVVVWRSWWVRSAERDRLQWIRLGGDEERRRIERQLARGSVQCVAGQLAAAAWWQNEEDHGTACVLDFGGDRLFLVVDLMEDTMPRDSLPKRSVELEFLEETKELLSVLFEGEPIDTQPLPLDEFPPPPDPDRDMLATWFVGTFASWQADLRREVFTTGGTSGRAEG